jgi:transcriptional regulator of acetoin/glycerol metabolism
VLLADVGALPVHLQEVVLRVLRRREVVPLGMKTPAPVGARCLATSTGSLRARVAQGLFAHALFSRLAANVLRLPPLRERKDEIALLARQILEQSYGRLPAGAREMTEQMIGRLSGYAWPGNLHELRESVENAAFALRGARVHRLRSSRHEAVADGPSPSLRDIEKHHILRVLRETRGNQRHAARILGVSRWTLARRLRRYRLRAAAELPPPAQRNAAPGAGDTPGETSRRG